MKILLDTHILLWALMDRPILSALARKIIAENRNDLCYSIVSVWEIAIKHKLHPENLLSSGEEVAKLCQEANLRSISLTNEHISAFEKLVRREDAPSHKDPFDQILISQAIAENMVFLTHDKTLQYYIGADIRIV